MEKDYMLNHDWGSYESNESIKKLKLRDTEDFMKYFDNEIQNLYIAEMIKKYKFKFEDGIVIEFISEIVG